MHVGARVALDRRDVASTVDGILADPKGWGGSGEVTFRRAASGPLDFRIVLALPGAVDRLCFPLRTRRALSCATGTLVVLNVLRWRHGAPAFHGDVELYRRYLVNHEVGHVLGHGHASCPRAGARAPVMMQQTKGVGACRANGRPLAGARLARSLELGHGLLEGRLGLGAEDEQTLVEHERGDRVDAEPVGRLRRGGTRSAKRPSAMHRGRLARSSPPPRRGRATSPRPRGPPPPTSRRA